MQDSDLVSRIFEDVLERPVGPDEHFFETGGSSMLAISLILEIEKATGRELSISAIYNAPSIRAMEAFLAEDDAGGEEPIILLRRGPSRPCLFLVHGMGGTAIELLELARGIDGDITIYGIQAVGLDGAVPNDTIDAMARSYVDMMIRMEPDGPYLLVGFSLGGLVAFEMAKRLRELGREVGFLGLIDAFPIDALSFRNFPARLATTIRERPLMLTVRKSWWRINAWARRTFRPSRVAPENDESMFPPALRRVRAMGRLAWQRYRTSPGRCDLHFFQAMDRPEAFPPNPKKTWGRLVDRLTIDQVPGDHVTIVRADVVTLAMSIERQLRATRLLS